MIFCPFSQGDALGYSVPAFQAENEELFQLPLAKQLYTIVHYCWNSVDL
jgi:hypothetical protein